MAAVNKIDSNTVGLRIAEEERLGVLPTTPDWIPAEPNSFADFGATINTIARNPINPSRQRKKGAVVGLEATGGFATDLTQTNMQSLLQGFLFADLRTKNELSVTTISSNSFQPASGGDGFVAGDILAGKNFDDSANNGRFDVTGTPAASDVDVTQTLVDATGQSGTISRVGFTFASADLNVDVAGTLPAITSTAKDLTTLGLIVGEWVFIGGDSSSARFANTANNGFARVRNIEANRIEFDKTSQTMVAETGTGLTIEIYFGRVLKNEATASLIKRRTYQLERTLGAPDDANLGALQSEYIVGSVPNELTINIPQEEKITLDLAFVATNAEQRTAAQGLKTGNRPALIESDAFNTSSDVSRIRLAQVVEGDAAPTPLFAFAEDVSISLTNNSTPNKAVSVLGAFDVTSGTFEVSGDITAYFADIAGVQAVRNNADITLDAHLVKQNSGISIDLPLITLGDGKPNVEQDQSIKLPLSSEAATGAKIDPNLNHTMLMVFWDYLPSLADV